MTAPRVTKKRCLLVSASLKGSQRLIGELRLGVSGETDDALSEAQRELARLLRLISAVRRGVPVHEKQRARAA